MLRGLLLTAALVWTGPLLHAFDPSELERLEDALQRNFYAIEIIIFVRDPASVESTEPLINERVRIWPNTFMALAKQRQQQRSIDDDLLWTNEINGQRCFEHADADVPEFMRIVLSEGFESELLNDFSASGSQVTLDPALTADEQNPFSTANAPMFEAIEADANRVKQQPMALALDPLAEAKTQFQLTLDEFNASFLQDSWQWLEEDRLALRPQRQRIARAPELEVVFHGRWQQPVPARDAPQFIQLPIDHAGLLSQLMGLSGHIGVTLGRYLHVNTHLWLQPDLSQDDFAVLSESRRMRSNELHYVDHPHMGVLINITPFEPDTTLEQSWQTLQQAIRATTP